MGAGNCCAGRDNKTVKYRERDAMDKTWDFLQGEAITSDIDLFDKAYATNDVKGFVSLLNSNEPIGIINQKIHPWAADPVTISALAVTQLAILAAKEDEPAWRDKIRDAGAIPTLVDNLASPQEDRQHASVVALSFLTVERALPLLVKGLSDNLEGLRAASAQISRNLYVLGRQQRNDFKKCGGVEALVSMLKPLDSTKATAPTDDDYFNQLEIIYHIEDYITDSSEDIPEAVEDVKKAGAIQYLEVLIQSPNEDLKEAAQYLLAKLK